VFESLDVSKTMKVVATGETSWEYWRHVLNRELPNWRTTNLSFVTWVCIMFQSVLGELKHLSIRSEDKVITITLVTASDRVLFLKRKDVRKWGALFLYNKRDEAWVIFIKYLEWWTVINECWKCYSESTLISEKFPQVWRSTCDFGWINGDLSERIEIFWDNQ